MAQQIKKKFIAPDAIDGSKLKLMEGEALRLQTPAGEVELLKKDAQGKLVSEGDEISFKGDIEAHVESVRAALQANIDSEESARIADVDSEESRAMGVESSLQSQITQEISDRIADVNEEQSRAEGVESSLQSQITQEISDRIADVNAEESRAMGVEDSLQSQINSEVSTRQSEVTRVEGLLSTEESARIAGDLNLQNQIDNVLSNIDPTALDSLTEIVAAFQEADSSLQGAISTLAGNSSGNISAEQSRAEAVEASLQAQINQEISDRQADVDAEESRAMGVESSLQSQITQEISDRMADVDAEEMRAMEIEGSLQSQISQEISDREAEDLLMFKKDGSRLMTGNINMGGGSVGPRTRTASNFSVMEGVLQPGVNFSGLLDNGFDKLTETLKVQKVVNGVPTDIAIWSEGMWSFVDSNEIEVTSEPAYNGGFSFTTTFTGFLNFVFIEQVAAGLKIVNLANGTSSTDAANYGQVLSVSFTVSNLQNEVNTTQTGAGLSASGTYVPNVMSNFIGGATSLSNADSLLDSALSQEISDRQTAVYDEQSRAEAVESYLLTLSQQETSDRIADVDEEESRAMGVEASLQSQITQEISDRQADVDAEESRAMGVESSLQAQITQEISDRVNAISSEESSRIAADQNLQSQIDNVLSNIDPTALDSLTEIVAAFQSADSSLQGAISTLAGNSSGNIEAEESRAMAVEASLQSQITQEISDRIADVDAEESRAMGVESSLQSQISQEISDRQAAVSSEESARIAEDLTFVKMDGSRHMTGGLTFNVGGNNSTAQLFEQDDTIALSFDDTVSQVYGGGVFNTDIYSGQIDIKYSTTGTTRLLGGLIDLIESGTFNTPKMPISPSNVVVKKYVDDELNSEESRAMAVESSLQSQITQEISDRQDDVNAEESRALVVEGLLSDRLDVLEALAFEKESFTLGVNPTGITLAHSPKAKSTVMFVGRLALHEGLDYSISGNQVTFIGDFAYNSEDEIAAAEGDVVKVTYYY